MISKEMGTRLNDQLNKEFHASYLYLSMSAFCSTISYPGFASWFLLQSQEEYGHAMKIYNYLLDVSAAVKLQEIHEPTYEFKSLVDVIEQTLKHEKAVTASINQIAGAALEESDHATNVFLHWFITEQIEEESTVSAILERLVRVQDSNEGKLILDRELGTRTPE